MNQRLKDSIDSALKEILQYKGRIIDVKEAGLSQFGAEAVLAVMIDKLVLTLFDEEESWVNDGKLDILLGTIIYPLLEAENEEEF